MNDEALEFAIAWLRDRGVLKDVSGSYVLELIEAYLDQNHDFETVKDVPELFCEIVIELIENDYLC